jgi:tRNA(adenine34) deaminase
LEKIRKQGFDQTQDEQWMQLALRQAKYAALQEEVPVGAVVVFQGRVIGEGYNHREKDHAITGHAELMAMAQASRVLKTWRLKGCTLYVTLEPCMMCTGALIQSRIDRIVFALSDPKSGALRSVLTLEKIPHLVHRPILTYPILASASKALLSDYFKTKRDEKN